MTSPSDVAPTAGRPVMWFEIRVRDVQGAMAFYRGLCGWQFSRLAGYAEPYWLIDGSGAAVQGALMAGDPSGDGTRLYVEVTDLQQAIELATRLGGREASPPRRITPTAGTFAVITDPEGNHLGLWTDS
jgi:predicted enzyme related to lactoylglutathione lyase